MELALGEHIFLINGIVFSNSEFDKSNTLQAMLIDTNYQESICVLTIPLLSLDKLREYRRLILSPSTRKTFDDLVNALTVAKYFDIQNIEELMRYSLKRIVDLSSWQKAYLEWYIGLKPKSFGLKYDDYVMLTNCPFDPMPEATAKLYCDSYSVLLGEHTDSIVQELRRLHPVLGLLFDNNLLNKRAFIAGGAIIEAAVNTYWISPNVVNNRVEYSIDIFVCFDWEPFVKELMDLLKFHKSKSFVRDDSIITITTPNYPVIQVIGSYKQNSISILEEFDLGCCQIACDGKELWTTSKLEKIIKDEWTEIIDIQKDAVAFSNDIQKDAVAFSNGDDKRIPVNLFNMYQDRGINFPIEEGSFERLTIASLNEPAIVHGEYSLEQLQTLYPEYIELTFPLKYPIEDWVASYCKKFYLEDPEVELKNLKPWDVIIFEDVIYGNSFFASKNETIIVDTCFDIHAGKRSRENQLLRCGVEPLDSDTKVIIHNYIQESIADFIRVKNLDEDCKTKNSKKIKLSDNVIKELSDRLDTHDFSAYKVNCKMSLMLKIHYGDDKSKEGFCFSMYCVGLEITSVVER